MPHSTRASSATRASNLQFPDDTNKANSRSSMEKFPDHIEPLDGQSPYKYPSSPTHTGNGYTNGSPAHDRWGPRRNSAMGGAAWNNGTAGTGTGGGGRGHGRQKSLSDAFKTIRGRKASVSQNVHEVADALKAPVSPKLVVRNPPRQEYISNADCPEFGRFSASSGICRAPSRIRPPNLSLMLSPSRPPSP